MESGCSTAGNPLAEARELREAKRAQQPSTSAPRTSPGGLAPTPGLAEAQCFLASSPGTSGWAQHEISFQFPTLLIVFQDKER